ncbi:MAG TPA: DUF4232 domain-containing protein [Gemmatimonadales bacterium]|jgi:hypothetical protein
MRVLRWVGVSALLLAACHKAPVPPPIVANGATDSSGAAPNGGCRADQLTPVLGREDAGMGHRTVRVQWRNDGEAACRVTGFPAVGLFDSGGVAVAVRVDSVDGAYLTGSHSVATVTLAPHGVAVFDIGWTVVEGQPGGCVAGRAFRVSVPGATVAAALPALAADVKACGARLTVTPVVALDSLTPGERDQ